MRTQLALLALGLALFAPQPPARGEAAAAGSGQSPYAVSARTDWQRRVLVLEVALDLAKAGLGLPDGRLAAGRMVQRDIAGLAKDALFALPLDSSNSVGDSVMDEIVGVEAVLGLASRITLRSDSLSKDQRNYVSTWELPLGAAIALYPRASAAVPLPVPLRWKPSRAWTGIVIYADGPLPVHGERGVEDRIREALFPRVFDSDMNLLVDRDRLDPEALLSWGVLGYAAKLGAAEEARVGDRPLALRAVELFGRNRSDLVISGEDAASILALAANRDLVAAGKILVIVGASRGGPGGE